MKQTRQLSEFIYLSEYTRLYPSETIASGSSSQLLHICQNVTLDAYNVDIIIIMYGKENYFGYVHPNSLDAGTSLPGNTLIQEVTKTPTMLT